MQKFTFILTFLQVRVMISQSILEKYMPNNEEQVIDFEGLEKTIKRLSEILTNVVREYIRIAIFEFGEGEEEWGDLVDALPEQIHISDIDFSNERVNVFADFGKKSEHFIERYTIPICELKGFIESGCSVDFFYDLEEERQQKEKQMEIESLEKMINEEQEYIRESEQSIKDWILKLKNLKGEI